MIYIFKKCLDCSAVCLATDKRCWYCDGENLDDRAKEWEDDLSGPLGEADPPPAPYRCKMPISTLEAEEIAWGTPVVCTFMGEEYPAIFLWMDWAIGDDENPRRRAYITIDGVGVMVPAWWLTKESE